MKITLLLCLFAFSCARTAYTTKPTDGKDGSSITGPKGDAGVPGAGSQPGLECQVYDSRSIDRSSGLFTILNNATPKFTKIINQFDVGDSQAASGFPKFTAQEQALVGTEDYALDCSGYINIPVSGYYSFRVLSDDGSKFAINDILLVDMDQLQAPTYGYANNKVLYKGLNRINVLYFQGPLTQLSLRLDWKGPTSAGLSTLQLIGNSYLTH